MDDGRGRPLGTPLRGRLVERLNVTGDDGGHPYGKRGRRGMMLEGEWRFANRSYGEGLDSRLLGDNGRSGNDVVAYGAWGTGDHKGCPYGGRDGEV